MLKILIAQSVIMTLFIVVFLELVMIQTAPTYNIIVRAKSKTVAMYLSLFVAVFLSKFVLQSTNIDKFMNE